MYVYDVHDLLTVRSTVSLPMLEYFRTERSSGPADLTVEVGGVPVDPGRTGQRSLPGGRYWDARTRRLTVEKPLGARIAVQRPGGRTVLRTNRRYLWLGNFRTVVRSLLQAKLLVRDATFAFAAGCLTPDGTGVFLAGLPGSGKSTTTAELAGEHDWRLLGDDLVVVHEGDVLAFPKPVRLDPDSHVLDRPDVQTCSDGVPLRRRVRRRFANDSPLAGVCELLPGVPVPGERRIPLQALGSVATRATVDACVFLAPDCRAEDGSVSRLSSDETCARFAYLDRWVRAEMTSHPLVQRALYLDPDVDLRDRFERSLETAGSVVEDAAGYEVCAPPQRLDDLVAGRFD